MPKGKTKLYYLDTPEGKDIAKRFFLKYTNQTEVSKEKYPKSSDVIPYVNKLFQLWKEKNFFEEKIVGYGQRKNKSKGKTISKYPKKRYRLNLIFFFDFTKVRFTDIEKGVIGYIFSFQKIRELACSYDNLTEGILNVLERIFLFKVVLEQETRATDYIKAFLVNNKEYVEKAESPREQYEIFWRKELELNQNISNKIKLISSSYRGDFLDIWKPIQKYSFMPTIIPHYLSKKEQEKLLTKWGRVFYKNEDISKDWKL